MARPAAGDGDVRARGDTSLINVSIASGRGGPRHDRQRGQSAIPLEALVSAALILVGSEVGDLIGRERDRPSLTGALARPGGRWLSARLWRSTRDGDRHGPSRQDLSSAFAPFQPAVSAKITATPSPIATRLQSG